MLMLFGIRKEVVRIESYCGVITKHILLANGCEYEVLLATGSIYWSMAQVICKKKFVFSIGSEHLAPWFFTQNGPQTPPPRSLLSFRPEWLYFTSYPTMKNTLLSNWSTCSFQTEIARRGCDVTTNLSENESKRI